jgi:hypothetical protein
LAGLPISNKQSNIGAGVEVKIQEGAYLLFMWNKLSTQYTNMSEANFDQNIANVKLQVAF